MDAELYEHMHYFDCCCYSVADPRGLGGAVPPFLEFTSKKVVLNEYEIFLKMLEMAIIETQIFKTFWGSIPQDPSM